MFFDCIDILFLMMRCFTIFGLVTGGTDGCQGVSLTVLSLFEKLCETDSLVKQSLCGGIKIGSELSEGSDLTVLSQLQLHGGNNLQTASSKFSISVYTI